MDVKTIEKIRKKSFSKKIPLSNGLIKIIEGNERHAFLRNPASQNNYLFLLDFVKSFSEVWFGKPFEQLRILDWGCGKGQITYLLKEMHANVVSCDAEDDSDDSSFGQNVPILEQAKIKVVPLKHPYLLPFDDRSFDIVLSFGVLEHVPNDQESLKEINRVLSDKGMFFCFFLPYIYSWTQKISHMRGNFYHDRLYNKKIVNRLLSGSNFNLVDYWHRALLPKNTIDYPGYRLFEALDQSLCEYTFLKQFATNVEFVAVKNANG